MRKYLDNHREGSRIVFLYVWGRTRGRGYIGWRSRACWWGKRVCVNKSCKSRDQTSLVIIWSSVDGSMTCETKIWLPVVGEDICLCYLVIIWSSIATLILVFFVQAFLDLTGMKRSMLQESKICGSEVHFYCCILFWFALSWVD